MNVEQRLEACEWRLQVVERLLGKQFAGKTVSYRILQWPYDTHLVRHGLVTHVNIDGFLVVQDSATGESHDINLTQLEAW